MVQPQALELPHHVFQLTLEAPAWAPGRHRGGGHTRPSLYQDARSPVPTVLGDGGEKGSIPTFGVRFLGPNKPLWRRFKQTYFLAIFLHKKNPMKTLHESEKKVPKFAEKKEKNRENGTERCRHPQTSSGWDGGIGEPTSPSLLNSVYRGNSCPPPKQGRSDAPLRGPTPASAASRRCRGRGAALRTN